MFLKMKVLFLILPVLSSAQFGHRQDRVYLHVNKQVPYEIQPSQEFYIESDSLKSQGYFDERGTQFNIYPINNRDNFNNQRINIPIRIQSRLSENVRSERRGRLNERMINEDDHDHEEDISVEENQRSSNRRNYQENSNRRTSQSSSNRRLNQDNSNSRNEQGNSNRGTKQVTSNTERNQNNFNTRIDQGNNRSQPTRRTINDNTDQHNIVFIDTDNDTHTNKPHITKTTYDNEISSSPRTDDDDDDRKTTTAVTPSVDDRAAFVGDKCPEGRVRFNGICVETDDR